MCNWWPKIACAVRCSWYSGAFVGPTVGWIEGISSVWLTSSLDHSYLAHSEPDRWRRTSVLFTDRTKDNRQWSLSHRRGGREGGMAEPQHSDEEELCLSMVDLSRHNRAEIMWSIWTLHRPTREPSSVAVPLFLTSLLAEMSTFAVVYAVLELPTVGRIFWYSGIFSREMELLGLPCGAAVYSELTASEMDFTYRPRVSLPTHHSVTRDVKLAQWKMAILTCKFAARMHNLQSYRKGACVRACVCVHARA